MPATKQAKPRIKALQVKVGDPVRVVGSHRTRGRVVSVNKSGMKVKMMDTDDIVQVPLTSPHWEKVNDDDDAYLDDPEFDPATGKAVDKDIDDMREWAKELL